MPNTLLTVAGSDPSGAAGVQVDLQVARDFRLHGLSVLTAVVWQNTQGVRGFQALSPDVVIAQLDAVLEDLPIGAIKLGMIPTPEVARALHAGLPRDVPLVLDPVRSSGDGRTRLGQEDTFEVLRDTLATRPRAVLTPNTLEAAAWLQGSIETPAHMLEAARELSARTGCLGVLLKAGHLPGTTGPLADVYADASGARALEPLSRIPDDVRGTGCQLSSALACRLALGDAPERAAQAARVYLHRLLTQSAVRLGRGRPLIARTSHEAS